jgi:ribose transport system ATP-binding protein
VLKDGRTVATGLPAGTTPTVQLVSLMTGRTVEYLFPPRPAGNENQPIGPESQLISLENQPIRRASRHAKREDRPTRRESRATRKDRPANPLLKVDNLSLAGTFDDVSFSVRAGEIVGIAGLVGAGRSEVLETIYGARRRTAGSVMMDGRKLPAGNVHAAVRAGLGLAPEERKSQALLLGEPVARNVSLASLPRLARIGWLDRGREKREAIDVTRELDVRPPDVTRAAGTLSGGNQQKVVLARWLLGSTRLLLLDEPTRGVDVGARSELYAVIRRLAGQGIGVLLVSSEVPEVLGLADRVLVMREGRIVHQAAAADLDEHRVLDLVMEGSI